MFSRLMDLTSRPPPSIRISTSQRPLDAGRGSSRSTTPRRPLSCGALWRPIRSTACPFSSGGSGAATGAGKCISGIIGSGKDIRGGGDSRALLRFFGESSLVFGPVGVTPNLPATSLCISDVSGSNLRCCASVKSRYAFFQCPRRRCAMPRRRYAFTMWLLIFNAAVQSRIAAQGRFIFSKSAERVQSICGLEPPLLMASV
mmetsp:Transcript_66748/g.156462  ORF Transcript_66748/g.156462 Transcript_66748/m.156462 type:complete len:201 (-) Transcript_66748:329-931(-)